MRLVLAFTTLLPYPSSMTNKNLGAFAIFVSGGPAPGINCVIASLVIEARNRGYEVFGFKDGFRGAAAEGIKAALPLGIDLVSQVIHQGGSIIGTSRFNPFSDQQAWGNVKSALESIKADKVVIIGGDGSAFLASQMIKFAPSIQVAHVPKTIDNDIALPNNQQSFGFVTAKSAGSVILNTLNVDARTEQKRWFIVTTMGRKAGFLALSLGVASGATLTLIPEEFVGKNQSVEEVADIVFESIRKRYAQGRSFGVAVLAEGIVDQLSKERSPQLQTLPKDDLGRTRYNLVEIGDLITPILTEKCESAGIDVRVTPKDLGYELRCHPPGAFDIEYTRFLGFGAVRYLLQGKSGITILRDHDNLGFQPLSAMTDPQGKIISRVVDLESDLYTVARSYMIR